MTTRLRHLVEGLSPRGRGNRTESGGRGGALGSIPAWAGEPETLIILTIVLTVYPRVGGGTGGAEPVQ